jgi:hypothetical protein
MRNAEYIPVAQIPMVDLSAQYEAAKARREEAELRKLEYLNSFQKNRGAIAEGVRPEVEKLWNEVQDSLASGDMSFEAKKKRQELYNNYAGVAADAVNWTRALDEREATILANPEKFTNPSEVLGAIEEDRFRPISAGAIPGETSALPSLSQFYRYKIKTMTPGEKAVEIIDTLKKTGGINRFYDENTGKVDRQKIAKYISDYALVNQLNEEEEDAALASVMTESGLITQNLEGLSKLQGLPQSERSGFLSQYWSNLGNAVANMIDSDIQTQAEQDAAELNKFAAKVGIQGRQTEREIALRAKQAQVPAGVDTGAALRSYLESNIGGDKAFMYEKTDGGKPVKYITSKTKEIADNLSPVLSKLGYKVTQTGTKIKITNPDGTKTETIAIPEEVGAMANAKARQTVVNEIISSVVNSIPAMEEDQVLGQSFYLNDLYNSGVIGGGQAVNDDPLGILIE